MLVILLTKVCKTLSVQNEVEVDQEKIRHMTNFKTKRQI